MKEIHLTKRERRRFIIQFAQLSKTQLQEIKTLVDREIKNKVLREHGKDIKQNEKKSIIIKILSLFKRARSKKN